MPAQSSFSVASKDVIVCQDNYANKSPCTNISIIVAHFFYNISSFISVTAFKLRLFSSSLSVKICISNKFHYFSVLPRSFLKVHCNSKWQQVLFCNITAEERYSSQHQAGHYEDFQMYHPKDFFLKSIGCFVFLLLH